MPHTEMMYRFLAPLLSQQFMTAATGRPRVMRYLLPWAPARPVTRQKIEGRGFNTDKRIIGRVCVGKADRESGGEEGGNKIYPNKRVWCAGRAHSGSAER